MRTQLHTFLVADLAAKIRWRMRFDRNPVFIRLQDKLAVRAYAAERRVATAGLLNATDEPETIPFDALPADYMIKANHGCGWNIICLAGQHYRFGDGRSLAGTAEPTTASAAIDGLNERVPLTREEVVVECRRWLNSRYSTREWAYQHIPPRIIVEYLMVPLEGKELLDYRFYTFDGVVKAINVGSPTYRRDHLNVFYDVNWNQIELSRYAEALPQTLPPRPKFLDEMVATASRLGKGLDFVRIDLYDTAGGIVLGEITVYPESGTRGMPTGCPRFNRWLGDQWRMTALQKCAVWAWNIADFVPSVVSAVMHRMRRFAVER